MLTCSFKSQNPSSLSYTPAIDLSPHGVPPPYAQALRTFSAQPQRTSWQHVTLGAYGTPGMLGAAPLDILPLGSYVTPKPEVGHADLAREGSGL